VTIELFGEGKAEVGSLEESVTPPTNGILPRLVHALCGKPDNMRVRRRAPAFLEGKGMVQKVRFAKRQARYNESAGAVFILDTEGNQSERMRELTEGRDAELPEFPMAVGAPHPCIEAWLLADPAAIKKGMQLERTPETPDDLECLPAPSQDRKRNPKIILAVSCNVNRAELSAKEKDQIASEIRVLERLRERCPTSFAPFADEIERIIRPLFSPAPP
jgi:hypothetical protein